MIFSPEGVVSSQDYEYQIKAVCKMVSNRNHAFGAAEMAQVAGLKSRQDYVKAKEGKGLFKENSSKVS